MEMNANLQPRNVSSNDYNLFAQELIRLLKNELQELRIGNVKCIFQLRNS